MKKLTTIIVIITLLLTMAVAGCKEELQGVTNYNSITLSDDLVVGGDASVGDTLTVTGDIDYDGDGFDVNTTGAVSIDADAASNFNVAGAGIDLTFESEAGSIVIKGDEALATAITLDANDNAATGVTASVGATNGFIVSGGKLDIQTGPLTLENDESIVNTDGIFDFTRNDAGVVTLTCSDDDATAGCVYDAGGASPIVIGSADVTAITLSTDNTGDGSDVVLPAQAINSTEILNDTVTFAQISDSSAVDADTNFTMADGIELSLTPSYTSGDVEALLIDINQVDDGANTDDVYALKIAATSESGDAGDTFYGVGIVWENGTANTIMDAAISIDNAETTASTMSDAVIVTSSGVAAGVTDAFDASASNIVNALNAGGNLILGVDDTISIGATDDTFIFDRNDSGSVTYTCTDDDANATCIYDSGGTGNVEIGSADTTLVTINADGSMVGTTPFLTMGDAGEEDTGLVFDGNAKDFYIGLDDTADDLVFGVGSALGTTQALGIDENNDVAVASDLTIAGLLRSGFADETITDGETLTPTVTTYALDSAGNVTMTLAASASEGQFLILIGDDANTVTVADTNVRTSTGGSLAIGQYDVAMFVYQDAEWVECFLLANS